MSGLGPHQFSHQSSGKMYFKKPKPHRLPPLGEDEPAESTSQSPKRRSRKQPFEFNISDIHSYDVPNMRNPSVALMQSRNKIFLEANTAPPPPKKLRRDDSESMMAQTSYPHENMMGTPPTFAQAKLKKQGNPYLSTAGNLSMSKESPFSFSSRLPVLKDVFLGDKTPSTTLIADAISLLKRAEPRQQGFDHQDHKRKNVAPNDEEEIAQLRTGEDAIAFFSRAGKNSAVKFVYLNKAPSGLSFRPYDLVVVSKAEAQPEHFTMSASGVVYIQPNQPSEFMSLSEWMKESTLFNVLTKMRFFKHYLIRKAYTNWRKNARFQKYCKTRNELSRKFFIAKETFCPTIMNVQKLCFDISNVKMIQFIARSHKHNYNIDDFSSVQEKQRSAAAKEFEALVDMVEDLLVQLCDSVTARSRVPDMNSTDNIEAYLMGTGPAVDGDDAFPSKRSKSMVDQQQEQLDKIKALKKAMEEAEMLGSFIRLVDYMVAESLITLAKSTLGEFVSILQCENKSIMFQVTLSFKGETETMYHPSLQMILDVFRKTADELLQVTSQSPRILNMRAFKLYLENDDQVKEERGQLHVGRVIREDVDFKKSRSEMEALLKRDFEEAIEHGKTFEPLRVWFLFGEQWDSESYLSQEHSVIEFTQDIEKLNRALKMVDRAQVSKEIGILTVESKNLKNHMIPVLTKILDEIKQCLQNTARDKCQNLLTEFQTRVKSLHERPSKLNEFAYFVENLNKIRDKSRELLNAAEEIEKMYDLLEKHRVTISTTDSVRADTLKEIRDEFLSAITSADEYKTDMLAAQTLELENKIKIINDEILNTMSKLRSGDFVRATSNPVEVIQQLDEMEKSIESMKDKAEKYSDFQALFKIQRTEWLSLRDIEQKFHHRSRIWKTIARFNGLVDKWQSTFIEELDVEDMNREVLALDAESRQLNRNPDEVTEYLKSSVDQWKQRMPVVLMLGNKALKVRHWKKIFEGLHRVFSRDTSYTLQQLKTYKIFDHRDLVTEISGQASGEAGLEHQLEKITNIWKTMEFIIKQYRDAKDVFIIGDVEEVKQSLEDHQVTLQTMMVSPFVTGIKDKIDIWSKQLAMVADVLEEWLMCQKNWMYLEFIFSSEDIKKQLPTESTNFAEVDKEFKDKMVKVNANKNVLKSCTEEGTLDMFIECNKTLEAVQKSLEDYLETKREAFPRFCFLSNDELIQILSQTREPRAVQNHLIKCFDNIKQLEFKQDSRTEILAMLSSEQEKVPFSSPVYARGNVEHWLQEIEKRMKTTLYAQMKECLTAYNAIKREDWFFKFPAQCVLTVDQMIWTQQVTEALEKIENGTNPNALREYSEFYESQIKKMVMIVRGSLTSLQRTLMGALLVVDVHARDVIEKLLKEQCTSPTDFQWSMQLRYFWDAEVDNCVVQQANSTFHYGYEYQGNQPRLVITPLTDRCYLTCTGALHMQLGGSPQGPAGTGKTESVKDLAKALARQCVVFNCSEGLNYRMMGRMFSGLAQAGAWACFDEFNRIDIEVLSVIAQQMRTIQKAIQSGVEAFQFEGRYITMNFNYGVFITMNPGYAGRTELPDNLKALFRPVSMMIPDYALIAEIMLFSEGFTTAKTLAQKMVQLFKLSSEQLSKQDHYDFGMRAVKSILVMAGALKRQNPDLAEETVLIRAMRDSNVPKFLENDVTLFMAIIQDLYPGIDIPNVDHGILQKTINNVLVENSYDPVPAYMNKIIQLYETLLVRHGVMLVGATGSGKSVCYNTLAKTLTRLKKEGHSIPLAEAVHIFLLNPKSVSMEDLYGYNNEITREWTDGLIARIAKDAVADTSSDRKWIVFDGPVDALWVENMNTVLDDNKMLCLTNGERIKLPSTVTMMFEVQDLAVASPATVSRCGMVYMEEKTLDGGWRPLAKMWLRTFETQASGKSEILRELFERFFTATLKFIRQECSESIPSVNSNLVMSCLKLLDALLTPERGINFSAETPTTPTTPAAPTEEQPPQQSDAENETENAAFEDLSDLSEDEETDDDEEGKASKTKKQKPQQDKRIFQPVNRELSKDEMDQLLKMYFVFAFVWTLGGNIEEHTRDKFDSFARGLIDPLLPEFPDSGQVYDYYVDPNTMTFQSWSQIVPNYEHDPKKPYFNILVPTVDTTRFKYLLEALISVDRNVLLTGVTGVGKTVIVQDFLRETLDVEHQDSKFGAITASFSAQTTCNNLQDLIESKLEKKRNNCIGAPVGKKMVMYIDDLNMPAPEEYGAQPPIELLRQTIDHGGFYDRDRNKKYFKYVTDTIFIASCGPPGGGRNDVTPRLIRHFHQLNFPSLSTRSMKTIFNSILSGFLQSFGEEIAACASQIGNATIEIYERMIAECRPTPSKSHYTFNLRDLSKVVQGILQIQPSNLQSKTTLLRLWCHESCRIFRDRLVNEADRTWFDTLLHSQLKQHFNEDWSNTSFNHILFGNFMVRDENIYQEIKDNDEISGMLREYLIDYNVAFNKEVSLVFFRDAIEHLSRLCRIIRQPRGNALLIGVGGSGRQSLTRLAAFMADCKCFQIEISKNYRIIEFREDLKKILLTAGCEGKPVVFLLSDNQIVSESFLEDVNSILNTGEVPNLFAPEDMEQILLAVRQSAKEAGRKETREGIYSHFVQRVRENLHIVISMSHIGDSFRQRIRMFPSLINCCTIDWYDPWPDDALFSVAKKTLSSIELLKNNSDLVKKLAQLCVKIHNSVNSLSKEFLESLNRHTYTTPTSYLELLTMYSTMLNEQRESVINDIKRFSGGLDKLLSTNEMVSDMQQELTNMQPQLEQSVADTAALLTQLKTDQQEADEVRAICIKEEHDCQAITDSTKVIRDECQRDLDAALPAYREAQAALQSLSKNKDDITEIRTFTVPPPLVVTVMEAVCILLNISKPKWEDSKRQLQDPSFLSKLLNYNKEGITDATLRRLKKYVDDPNFVPDKVQRVSNAARSLCLWVRAMHDFATLYREIEPKRKRLAEAEQNLEVQQKLLQEKQNSLRAIEDRVAELQSRYEDSLLRKKKLTDDIKRTEVRLERAEKLVNGLSDERVRWEQAVQKLEAMRLNLAGNVIIAAGVISYLGPFTAQFRSQIIQSWIAECIQLGIPVSETFSLSNIVDPVLIREWTIRGLPSDNFSVDNGIITTKGRRWPLMIDPQEQANKWIKNMEQANNLKVIKLTDVNFLRTLENSIMVGIPVLIENVGETLDPVLEPILLKQTYRKLGRLMIKLGDKEVDYSPNFRLYITTKLANPHYLPEICIKVTVINFTVTLKGLEDQLLAEVIRFERPELEQQRDSLVVEISQGKDKLKETENHILSLINNATGMILDDEILINVLSESKKQSEHINESVSNAEATAVTIETVREGYRTVATRGSILYFVIADLSMVDPMYQYSLQFYNNLFLQVIKKTEKSDVLEDRLRTLIIALTETVYVTICRGLFEKHKVLFSFMMSVQILQNYGTILDKEWAFFLRGSGGANVGGGTSPLSWISEKTWNEINALAALPGFEDLSTKIIDNPSEWESYMECDEPHKRTLPDPYEFNLSQWRKLLLLKTLREEKLLFGISALVSAYLGPKFTESPPFDLEGSFADSIPTTPIIFILSPGADPQAIFDKFAKEKDKFETMQSLSLGQGQGPKAESMIKQGIASGFWVFLQNCHLAESWMPSLEKMMEDLPQQTVHPEFRLWLTSMPSAKFPVPVLQNGIKLTNEPPKGLKANIKRSFADLDDENFNATSREPEYKRLLFGLTFFHALIQERRKFGPLGWNIPYEWNNSDLYAAMKSLQSYLNQAAEHIVPWQALRYIIGVINYGGRVTDFLDLRCVQSLLSKFFEQAIFDDTFTFFENGYYPPLESTLDGVRTYISSLPPVEMPDIYGLHENANITLQKKEAQELLETIILTQPRKTGGGGDGKSQDELVYEMADDILTRLPETIDIDRAHASTFTVTADGSVNSLGTFLSQEIVRFNRLLTEMNKSLNDLQSAIKGLVVMSSELDMMYMAFIYQKVPERWAHAAYPSLKPLASWFSDLCKRIDFLRNWLENGPPACFWISGFYFPQGFLTGVLQTHSRQFKVPIDTLRFKTTVLSAQTPADIDRRPDTGVYIYGLFMEGARWDSESLCIAESRKGELYTAMPVIWLDPEDIDTPKNSDHLYSCPLYKTSSRAGALSTTGLSTNFVLSLDLPTPKIPPDHWVQRGVAILSMLND